jgi:type II secretory pathway pseudopilin PulG
VELLVVISILAVLAALLFPVATQMREKSDEIGCINNLKQIGTALNLYLGDNNQIFPGPLHASQPPGYTEQSSTRLAHHLSTYLGLPEPSEEWQYAKVFVSPGHLRKVPITEQPRSYRVRADHSSGYLFGYPGSGNQQPKSLLFALEKNDLRTWIMQDTDQTSGGSTATPPRPLHRSGRSTLFLNGSVEIVPFEDAAN